MSVIDLSNGLYDGKLATDQYYEIFRHLPKEDLNRLSKNCRLFRTLIRDEKDLDEFVKNRKKPNS